MTRARVAMFCLKLSITVGLLLLLLDRVDLGPLSKKLGAIQISWASAAVAALMIQLIATGIRWYYVGQVVDAKMRVTQATRLALIGQFFNQMLPSSIGGDGVRAWLLSREGIPLTRAVVSIVCDRVVALIVLTVVLTITLPILMHHSVGSNIPFIEVVAWTIPVVTAISLIVLAAFGVELSTWILRQRFLRPIGVLIRDMRLVIFGTVKSLPIIGLAAFVQIVVVIAVYLCAKAMTIDLRAPQLLLLPFILLVSMVPISFAGWGVRESAMVVGFGFTGMQATDALAISVAFGMAQIAVGLPGAALLLFSRKGQGRRAQVQ